MNPTPDLLGKVVRIWHHHMAPDAEPVFVGKVIGYYDHPAIIVQDADGNQSTHSSQLRMEIKDLAPEPPVGEAVALRVSRPPDGSWVRVWVRHRRGWFDPMLLQREPEWVTWEQLNLRGEVCPLVAGESLLPFTGPLGFADDIGDRMLLERLDGPGRVARLKLWSDPDITDNAGMRFIDLARDQARLAGEALLSIAAAPPAPEAS